MPVQQHLLSPIGAGYRPLACSRRLHLLPLTNFCSTMSSLRGNRTGVYPVFTTQKMSLVSSRRYAAGRNLSSNYFPEVAVAEDHENDSDDEIDPLTSWADPFDMHPHMLAVPSDASVPSQLTLPALDAKLQAYLGPEHEDVLQNLGVRCAEDIKYIAVQDLVSVGVPVVAAKKFMERLAKTKGDSSSTVHNTSGIFSAEETMKALAKKGIAHAFRSDSQIFASSFLGGALLGWGCCLTTVVAGGTAASLAHAPGLLSLLTGMVFPVGLSMVLLSGSELLTGNFTTIFMPHWTHPGVTKQRVVLNCMRVWSVSGAGNLAGSLFLACALHSLSVVQAGSPAALWLAALTVKKCSLGPLVAIGKGAGANWLVNCAIFQASSAHTSAGKIASLWLPIMTFVALGLEHSIANMFLLPLGMMLGADVGVLDIAGNIIPVLIGNAMGAIIFVGGVQRYSLLKNLQYAKPV